MLKRFSTSKQVNRVIRLYESGKSSQQIADLYQTSNVVVLNTLKRNGITPRKRSDYPKKKRWVIGDGYWSVWVESDSIAAPMRDKRGHVAEHRFVMAESLGRPLRKDETVHHINGNKLDNRLKNLELRSGHHGEGVAFECVTCGSRNVVPVELKK